VILARRSAKIQIVEYAFNRAVAIARSGLCTGPVQARLEDALHNVEALEKNQARTESDVIPVRTELEASYDAALDELERLAAVPPPATGGERPQTSRDHQEPRE